MKISIQTLICAINISLSYHRRTQILLHRWKCVSFVTQKQLEGLAQRQVIRILIHRQQNGISKSMTWWTWWIPPPCPRASADCSGVKPISTSFAVFSETWISAADAFKYRRNQRSKWKFPFKHLYVPLLYYYRTIDELRSCFTDENSFRSLHRSNSRA